jgi:ligand-binding sensor domain-containing protein
MMSRGWLRMLACAALVAAPAAALASGPAWRLSDYTRESWKMTEGLPQDSITAIRQTRDGYLWLATLDGLARFDGVRFHTVNLIREAGIGANVVTALAEDAGGTLWIGTRDGLVEYRNGRFVLSGATAALSNRSIRALTVGRDGSLWVATRWGGLNHLREGRVTVYTTRDGLGSDDVRAVVETPDRAVWIATAAGLHRMHDETITAVPVGPLPGNLLVAELFLDRTGRLWVGSDTSVWRLDPRAPAAATRVLDRVGARAFCEDGDGTLWIGTGSGLARVVDDVAEAAPRDSLTYPNVRSLATDHEGSLWIGTDGGGLNRYRKASVVLRAPGGATVGDPVMAVYRAADGAIWTGANCGGVTRWEGDRTTTYARRDGLPNDCIRSITGDATGAIWVGTLGGLVRIDQGRIRSWTTADGLTDNRVMAVAVTRDGTVWAGTGGSGVDRFRDGRVANLRAADGLGHDDVRLVTESRDGSVWIGTLGGGLARWREGSLTRLSRAEGLSNDNVLALLEDPDGTLWIGTLGGGLNRYRQGTFVQYSTRNGLFSDGIFQILDDGRGYFWLGCNRGIFRVSRDDLEAVASGRRTRVQSVWFGKAEGLRTAGVMGGTQPSATIDREGRLWFPTIEGVAVLDPRRLVKNTVPPPVHVEEIRVDRTPVPRASWAAIPPGRRSVEIDYTALSFVAPDRVQFRYRLRGDSDEWLDVGSRRTAYFTNLRPGRYRFEVKAANNDGVWNAWDASAEFTLEPFFYERRAFFAVYIIPVLGLLWLVYRLRVRALNARQRELGAQVEKATAELKVLSGLLPICASCKQIRDDGDAWKPVEEYIRAHTEATFSHGICPDCMKRLYPEYRD